MGTRIIYLVRHGQMGKGDPPDELGNGLTPLGQRQARRAALRLSGLPVSIIHYSTLRRAAETAHILAEQFPGVPLRPSRLLWECIPGWPISVRGYFKNIPRQEIEQGRRRAARAFRKYFRPTRGNDRHEIIVAHGNIIRYFALSALQVPPALWTHTDIRNCGLSEVQIHSDGLMMLIALNDTGHIPRRWLTYL
jgi:serine/threonine-protein phosphatase PGAM5